MLVRRLREDELYHHGVKGQRWGIRRYQNPDGSYTAAGKERYKRTSGSSINPNEIKNAFIKDDYSNGEHTKNAISKSIDKKGELYKNYVKAKTEAVKLGDDFRSGKREYSQKLIDEQDRKISKATNELADSIMGGYKDLSISVTRHTKSFGDIETKKSLNDIVNTNLHEIWWDDYYHNNSK